MAAAATLLRLRPGRLRCRLAYRENAASVQVEKKHILLRLQSMSLTKILKIIVE